MSQLRIVLTLCGVLCARVLFAAPAPTPTGDGSLFLVGGRLRDPNIYREIIQRSGGQGRARIGIISDASRRYAKENAADEIARFKQFGAAGAVRLMVNHKTGELLNPSALKRLTCLFFSGGDQERLRSIFMPHGRKSPGLRAIERARTGGLVVVAGTSAGAAVQAGRNMILGGESYEALRGEAEKSSDILRYKRPDRPGFGMFPFGVIDTHCSARGREGRMAVLAAATGRRLAFGVGEDTALVVGRTGGSRASMRVVGQNGVSVVDLSSAASRQHDGRWTIRDLRFSYLTSGDRLTLKKRPSTWSVDSLSVAAGKPRVVPHRSGRTPTTNDIFSSYRNRGPEGRRRPRQLVKAARVLFGYRGSSLVAGAFEDRGASARPILNVKLSKDARSRAYGGIRGRSVVNLRVDMTWKKKR